MSDACDDVLVCMFKNVPPEKAEIILRNLISQGVKEALTQMGLDGDTAAKDIKELRSLLTDWQKVKMGARESISTFLATLLNGASRIGALVLLWYIAWRLGWADPKIFNKVIP